VDGRLQSFKGLDSFGFCSMTINPYSSPQSPDASLAPKPGISIRRWIEVLVVVGVIGLLVALLLPAYRGGGPRDVSRRMQCRNHLKQIALALQNYESDYGALPPAYTTDEQGRPLHSWRTLILPYMEYKALYETIDLSKAWDDPANKIARETSIPAYQCPSADIPARHTTYQAVVAPGGCFLPTQPRNLAAITDDRDLTLMVIDVEEKQAVPWMSPADAVGPWTFQLGKDSQLAHPNVALAACVSGRVLVVPNSSTAEELRALISIAGNDDAIAGRVD
jgi:type II secretory pathway pseudopilin PulG